MADSARGPERTCLSCRSRLDKQALIRYVVAPDGSLLVDYRQRLPGRGAYTCVDLDCLRNAVKKGGFKRAFRGRCEAPDAAQLIAQLKQEVRQKIVNLLGICRKSGKLIAGSNAALDALKGGRSLCLLLLAEDISTGVADKVTQSAAASGVEIHRLFTKQEIGQYLGKSDVSCVAFVNDDLSELISKELCRHEQLVREN